MNFTHLHLLINHVAVVGAFVGMVVLLFAILKNSSNTYYAAYAVFVIAAVGGVIAYFTGESAEETVEGIVGVAEAAIEPHEESALFTIMGFYVLGVFSLSAMIVSLIRNDLQRALGIIILAVSLFSFSLAARTAWLGGKIRHTEINGATSQSNSWDED